MLKVEELKVKFSEKLKTAERHRQELCEYLNTASRLKEEDICKRMDHLLFEYRTIGSMENKIQMTEMLEKRMEKESIH